METETYGAIIECDNCGTNNTLEIPYGIPVKEHLRKKSVLCSNCKFRIIANGL